MKKTEFQLAATKWHGMRVDLTGKCSCIAKRPPGAMSAETAVMLFTLLSRVSHSRGRYASILFLETPYVHTVWHRTIKLARKARRKIFLHESIISLYLRDTNADERSVYVTKLSCSLLALSSQCRLRRHITCSVTSVWMSATPWMCSIVDVSGRSWDCRGIKIVSPTSSWWEDRGCKPYPR